MMPTANHLWLVTFSPPRETPRNIPTTGFTKLLLDASAGLVLDVTQRTGVDPRSRTLLSPYPAKWRCRCHSAAQNGVRTTISRSRSGPLFSALNLAAVARECQVNRKTAEGYLEILEDLLLGFRVDVFTKRAKRAVAAHPKFYFFDAGVFRTNRPVGPLDSPAELDGAALEGLAAQHLRAWCDYSAGRHGLHYWQTRAQVEIDFVVYGESGLYAVEVKNSRQVRPEDLRALKTFGEDYPQSRRYLLYRGKDRLQRDDVLCMPCEEFLLELQPDRFPK